MPLLAPDSCHHSQRPIPIPSLTYLCNRPIVITNMTADLRLLRPALAALALGLAGRVTAQSGSAHSPFLPPSAAAPIGNAPGETLEFAGVNVMGSKTFVSVFDKQSKKGRWIPVGGSDTGLSVLAYDPRREQIVIKSGEIQKTLTLRKATGTLNAPTPVDLLPPAAGFAEPSIASFVQKIQPPPPASTDLTGPATPPAGPVFDPNTKPAGEAKPLTVARQEEEARMLVSDLLEIGMAQRKAYEDAQKKASGGPTDPAAAPPPAPVNQPPGG